MPLWSQKAGLCFVTIRHHCYSNSMNLIFTMLAFLKRLESHLLVVTNTTMAWRCGLNKTIKLIYHLLFCSYTSHGKGKSERKKLTVKVTFFFNNIKAVFYKCVMGCLGGVIGCCEVLIPAFVILRYLRPESHRWVGAFIPFVAVVV